jgi:hypothetical protein
MSRKMAVFRCGDREDIHEIRMILLDENRNNLLERAPLRSMGAQSNNSEGGVLHEGFGDR